MKALREESGNAARALELVILCGTRVGEVTAATWREFDLDEAHWTVPPERMKNRKRYDVPLSEDTLALLRALPSYLDGAPDPDALLVQNSTGRALRDSDVSAVLRRIGYARDEMTTHGTRSAIRTYLAEALKADPSVAEAVLSHDRRGPVAEVIPLRAAAFSRSE